MTGAQEVGGRGVRVRKTADGRGPIVRRHARAGPRGEIDPNRGRRPARLNALARQPATRAARNTVGDSAP
jgi:hypothetical protein